MNVEFFAQFPAPETRILRQDSREKKQGRKPYVFLPAIGGIMDKSDQRSQLIASAKLTEEDIIEVLKSRRSYNRFGFAYQIGFVRLMNRFPAQTPQ